MLPTKHDATLKGQCQGIMTSPRLVVDSCRGNNSPLDYGMWNSRPHTNPSPAFVLACRTFTLLQWINLYTATEELGKETEGSLLRRTI